MACSTDNNCYGVDCLPEATQTGKGTFGCLVNGQPYVDNSGIFNCFYQLIDGEYYFGIAGTDDGPIEQIFIGSFNKAINVGTEIELGATMDQNFFSNCSFSCEIINCFGGSTKNENPGTISFSKLDFEDYIVSATFEFSVVDPNTEIVYEITEGRFDAKFTQ